jgi:hypothetical protein
MKDPLEKSYLTRFPTGFSNDFKLNPAVYPFQVVLLVFLIQIFFEVFCIFFMSSLVKKVSTNISFSNAKGKLKGIIAIFGEIRTEKYLIVPWILYHFFSFLYFGLAAFNSLIDPSYLFLNCHARPRLFTANLLYWAFGHVAQCYRKQY